MRCPRIPAAGGGNASRAGDDLRLTKCLLQESARMDLRGALELTAAMQAIVPHTVDQQEAVAAFLQKRAPVFQSS
jgi:hypothetical protein